MNIQTFVERYLPDYYKSGKWGCCLIRFERSTEEALRKEYPHGFKVQVTGKQYWVWLDKD
jgi:hypothetical protein